MPESETDMKEKEIITSGYKEFYVHAERNPLGELCGYVKHAATGQSLRFKSSTDFLNGITYFLDLFRIPRVVFEPRRWNDVEESAGERNAMKQKASKDNLDARAPEFLITIQYRYNSSWQGEIKWLNCKKEQRCRSALELIKLLDEAVEKSGLPAEDEMPTWGD